MRIGLDAMGGDHAPAEIVRGALDSLALLTPADTIVLIGRESDITAHLPADASIRNRIEIHHAPDVIGMDEAPVDALRHKKQSSIAIMAKLAADGAIDAVISAGNTGACAAACQLRMRTLPGVQRPGIAVVLPTFAGPVTVCDVGANVAPKPHHLLQYAQMATVFSEKILGVARPRVALLSVGGEETKGNDLVKQTRALISADKSLNFVGNVEGRDLYDGACDVAVCDGFVGNVVLKLSEGLAEGIFRTIGREIAANAPDLAARFDPVVKAIWAKHDYSEYGGAPLLGVDGIAIICHGSSKARAITNAVRVAAEFAQHGLKDQLRARITEETVDA